MKKLFVFVFLAFTAFASFGQSGRIRVSFVGFECIRETWDDILQSDGKGDEVYFNFGVTLGNRQGATLQKHEKRTPVYGDNSGPFSNRVNAGSAVDLFGGAKGGIRAGDVFRCNDIVAEYTMNDGDILTIIPTAWEYDPIADNMNAFTSTMAGLYNSINQRVAPVMAGLSLLAGDLGGVIYHGTNFGITKMRAGGDQGELGKPGTRPIGMEKYGDFMPKVIAFNTRNISTICSSNYGYGNGIIAVKYDEVEAGNQRDHGIYNILLKLEFVSSGPAAGYSNSGGSYVPPPAPSSGGTRTGTPPPPSSGSTSSGGHVPPPATSNTGGSYVPPPAAPNKQVKQVVTPVNAAVINQQVKTLNVAPAGVTGTWAGNFGAGTNYNGAFCCFRLNGDGTMQVLNSDKNIAANGTYKFENNNLTGTYIRPSGEIVSFSGRLDNNAITGTYGTGTNSSNQGTWRITRQGSVVANLR
ncbi:MAG: hypothetical protein ABW007_14280 [Chitinophagaceae bacterium]